MNKTKLGISTNMLAFVAIFVSLWGGFIPAILITGYVLIAENDMWLKKIVAKGFMILFFFTLLSALIGFLPNLLDFINAIFNLWGGYFSVGVLNSIINLINTILAIAEKVIMIITAFLALGGKWFRIGFVDKFIEKHFA